MYMRQVVAEVSTCDILLALGRDKKCMKAFEVQRKCKVGVFVEDKTYWAT